MPDFLPVPPTNAIADEQTRSVLDALSQNIQVAIQKFATTGTATTSTIAPSRGGLSAFGSGGNTTINNTNIAAVYTRQNLITDLANGAASIIAGGTSAVNVMKVGANYVVFQNSLASPLGTVAPYSGTVRTALGLFSTGIVGGYNDPTTGAWVSSITIDTSTGNLNVLGTIKANSIIQVGAYLGTDTVSTVLGNISTANSNAAYAIAATAAKLNKSASDILSGTINLTGAGAFATGSISVNGSGVASGSGVAITSRGIVGLNSGTPTFSVDATTGAATFKGDITGASGTFSGDITSSGRFSLSGTGFIYGGGSSQNTVAYINGASTIFGLVVDGGGIFSTAITAKGGSAGTGLSAVSTGGAAVSAYDYGNGFGILSTSVSGYALSISGKFSHNGVNIATPPNSNAYFLAGDGNWYSISTAITGVTTFNSRSGAVTLSSSDVTGALGFTPYSSSNPSGYVTSSGSVAYASSAGSVSSYTGYISQSQLIGSAPSSSYFLSGSGWTPVSVVNSLNGATGYVNTYFYANSTFPGVSFTVSGSGTNSVTYNVAQSSDQSLKAEIADIDLGLEFINSLKPKTYVYNSPLFGFKKKVYGLIANEVYDLLNHQESSLVYMNGEGELDGKLAVDYGSYVAPLIKAVQQLTDRILVLESKNA